MASLKTKDPAWIFTTTPDEMRLVLKALGGRLKPDEVKPAKELGVRLTRERIKALDDTAAQLREALVGEEAAIAKTH